MSNVNVDAAALADAAASLKNAITSIEATKAMLKQKYQQLGNGWNDKKYMDLGEIVQECLKALNRIESILVKGEKYVFELLKHLQEYENVHIGMNSGTDNRRNSFINQLLNLVRKKGESEKLNDFKRGMNAISERISNYAESLHSRGMPYGTVMDAILSRQRILEEAELIRNLNGDFSQSVPELNFDQIIASCNNSGIMNYQASPPTPRSLQQTQYSFTEQTINGVEMRVYNDPISTASLLIRQQGNSSYAMAGTCGLCQCSNLLTLAGVNNSNEDTIISAALNCSDAVLNNLDLFENSIDERGGTTTANREEILANCGLPTYSMPVNDFNRQETTQFLSEAIRTGHGVIVSVDVEHLWRNGQRGGHAISLISVSEDGQTFIYSDTGAGTVSTISAADLGRALTGRPANITRNIIR